MKRELTELAIAQETMWSQKLRALWLKERDSNTKFFHRVAVANRRRNFIFSRGKWGAKEVKRGDYLGGGNNFNQIVSGLRGLLGKRCRRQ